MKATLGRSLDQLRLGFESGTLARPARRTTRDFAAAFRAQFGDAAPGARGPERIAVAWVDTPLGPMVAGASPRGVCLLEFTDPRRLERQVEMLRRRFQCAVEPGDSPYLPDLQAELQAYFSGRRRGFTLPLDARGTPFEESVWAELLKIPYGETRSYEDLAIALGSPSGQRAVGRANGMNPVAIVIPCHRVVNKSGRLGGYGGGLWRKELLLRLEQTGQPPLAHDS